MNQPDEKSICTRCKKRPHVYGSAENGLCEVCASRVKAENVLNPEGKTPKGHLGGKFPQCLYCSDRADLDYGLGVACYRHAEECWRENDRKAATSKLGKKQQAIIAKKKGRDEESYKGSCRGCGKPVEGEYSCHDCRTAKQREALKVKDSETELWRGNVGKPEDKVVRQIVVKDASRIEPEETTWMWEHRIPAGAITWCMGQPNNGKSLLTIEVAASVTTGRDWPDGAKNGMPPSKVLMYCGEDSLSKIVVPRLMAAGADLTKVSFLDRKSFRTVAGDNEPEKRPLDLSQDCDVLLELIRQNPDVRMIVVDPITGVFGGKNINKNEEANAVFEQVIDLCEASGIAFLGILHVPKRTTNSAIEKIAGGTAVAGSAKSAFMLSRDPDSGDDHEHLLTMVKWNYTGKTAGLKYRTVEAEVPFRGGALKIAKIEWGGETADKADDVLAKQNAKPEERDRQIDKCEAFLMTFLSSGPRRSPDVYEAAEKLKFSAPTVKRALKNVGGHHIDRRAQRMGYWMSLEPDPSFSESASEAAMSVGAGEAL